MTTQTLGASIKRKEDPRLLTGEARYLDDIQLPGMVYAAILRSPYAHAKIKGINKDKAAKVPGVITILTGEDFKDLPALPCAWLAEAGRIQNNVNTPRVLEIDRVTHVGMGVAVVVAEDRYIAEDALNLIEVDYEPLPVVVDAEKTTHPGAPQIHENAPNNICFDWSVGDKDATDAELSSSDVVVKQRLVNQRLIPNVMEPRGCIAQYLPASEEYTVWMTSQDPHIM